MPQTCPHCGGSLAEGHKYCQHCGRRALEFKLCPKCDEPLSDRAASCPSCGQRLPSEREAAAQALQMEVRSTHLGAFFTGGSITGLLLPPIIRASRGHITVTKWSFLGLRTHNQEIQVSRVASVRYTKGIIWGGLLVETFGGAADDLSEKGLRQHDARMMAEQLKSCLRDEL